METSMSRRKFLRKTSLGTAGVALSLGSVKSLRGNLVQNTEKPAILGGTPVRTDSFPSWPIYNDRDIELYLEAYTRNRWSEYSNRDTELVVQFEKQYAELMGTKFCAATNAGTTALTAALNVVGVGPGDEVIVPTNTFIATAQAAFNLFALAVFIDSDPDTFMIDTELIEAKINERTKAILPVHIGGGAVNMDRIMEISEKYDIPVVEDVCQAHMGEWRNKKLGSIGHLGCFRISDLPHNDDLRVVSQERPDELGKGVVNLRVHLTLGDFVVNILNGIFCGQNLDPRPIAGHEGTIQGGAFP